MKNILFIIGLFFLAGCEKGLESFGFARATFNNNEWRADQVRCRRDNKCFNRYIGLELKKINKRGYIRETLTLSFYPIQGPQKLYKVSTRPLGCSNDSLRISGYYKHTDDGDVVSHFYELLESENNYVTITNYNENNKTISGNFNLTFILDNYPNAPDKPDTIRVTNGEFYTKIILEY